MFFYLIKNIYVQSNLKFENPENFFLLKIKMHENDLFFFFRIKMALILKLKGILSTYTFMPLPIFPLTFFSTIKNTIALIANL